MNLKMALKQILFVDTSEGLKLDVTCNLLSASSLKVHKLKSTHRNVHQDKSRRPDVILLKLVCLT